MRYLGPLIILLSLAGAVALRIHGHGLAQDLQQDELRALDLFVELQREAMVRAKASGQGHPGLKDLATRHPELELLPSLSSEPNIEFARSDLYMYGLSRSTTRDDDDVVRPTWVFRAWPLQFGRTGDLEYHVDQDGLFFMGQNELGRSGATVAFPPPFPQPKIQLGRNPAWWRAPLPPGSAQGDGAQR